MSNSLEHFIDPKCVLLNLAGTDRKSVLLELTQCLTHVYPNLNRDHILQGLLNREKDGSTGIGHGVAIPHIRTSYTQEILLAFGRSEKGIEFDAVDQAPVHFFFVLLAPEEGSYLKILAKISQLCMRESFCEELIKCQTPADLLQCLHEEENEK